MDNQKWLHNKSEGLEDITSGPFCMSDAEKSLYLPVSGLE